MLPACGCEKFHLRAHARQCQPARLSMFSATLEVHYVIYFTAPALPDQRSGRARHVSGDSGASSWQASPGVCDNVEWTGGKAAGTARQITGRADQALIQELGAASGFQQR